MRILNFLNTRLYLVGLAILAMSLFHTSLAQRYTIEHIGLEEGMPSVRVNDILEDSRGFVWIASEGAGLVRFDAHDFEQVDPGIPTLQPIVTALAEDSVGRLWFAMENELISYDGLSFKRHFLPSAEGRVIAIVFDDSQNLVVATRRAIYKLAGGDTLKRFQTPAGIRINAVAWYEQDLWIASDKGLFNGENRIMDGVWNSLVVHDGAIKAQSGEQYWSDDGTRSNIFRGEHLAARNLVVAALRNDSLFLSKGGGTEAIGVGNGLVQDDYKGLYIDRSDVVWLYSNSGLYKIAGTAYKLYEDLGEVFSVYRHGDEIVAGTGRGLARVNRQGLELPQQFPFGVILAIAYHDGYYWLGTESGLVRFDGENYRLVPLQVTGGDFVFALHSDGENLWIGAGIGVLRYRNGRIQEIDIDGEEIFTPVYAISEAEDGSLWFATYTQGIIKFSEGRWEVIRTMGGLSMDSLRFGSISAVSSDEVFLGTLSEGIFHVTTSGYRQITSEELEYAEVRAISRTKSGTIWTSTNKGIYKVIPLSDAYYVEHLQPTQVLMEKGGISQALYVDNDYLLAGTENGLLSVDLKDISQKRASPKLAITDIELFYGQIGGIEDYADGTYAFTQLPIELSLPHDLNFLSFKLSGLTGYQPGNLIYRYRIERGGEWTLAGRRREAVFSDLSPGSYQFQAQVTRLGEPWSDEVLEYSFRIKPPVWQQWWFILISILITGGLAYWYVHNRIKRINQRLRLENSLMDMERKALRLQMNPHFIFNALDSISSFIFKNDVEQAVRYLNNFAKLMRLTLESSMEHLHPVESEVSILKNYLELEKLRFQGKLEYQIDVSDEIDFDVGIPPMLIQPHVENAILHGIKPKDEPGTVNIRFFLEDELLICEVEDDGIGRERSREIQKRQDHRSMATQINHHRLELLKKSLGGQVEILITDKKEPTGTLVRISLPAEQY